MTENPTTRQYSASGRKLFPLPRGESQGEGKATPQIAAPAPKLVGVARLLRKNDTWAERLMWSWLRGRRFSDYKFRRQHRFGSHILDFFCLEAWLDIELDGSQHGFPKQQARDAERDSWLEQRGIRVLRFWNSSLRREKEAVRDTIWRTLQERAPHPLPDYCLKIPATDNNTRAVSPHPGPLPLGEGESSAAACAGGPASESRT